MKNPSCSARSTATARFLVAAIFIALVSAGPVVAATTLQIGVTPPSSVNEFRSSAILTWNSETGAVYKIQSRVSLDASTPWVTEDAVLATGTTASWTAPGSLQQAMFYQLLLPQPEIFSVEPAVVTPGVTTDFYVVGQRFPTNAVLRINGVTKSNAVVTSSTLITAPAFTPDLPGTYQFQLVVSGLVVSTFTVTAADPLAHPEQVLQGPPTEPPASPTTSFSLNFAKMDVKYEPQNKDGSAGRGVGGGGYPIDPDGPGGNPPVSLGRSVLHISRYSDDDDPAKCPTRFSAIGRRSRSNIQNNFTTEGIIGFNLQGRDNDQAFANTDFTRGGGGGGGGAKYLSLMKAKEKANQCKSPILPDGGVHPFSGEVRVSDADMIIPGRVLDFVWARTYRSRTGTNTTMGQRWSHSYDIHVEQNSGGILRSDGTGRRDLFTLSTNGVYSLNEFFEEGTISNNAFTLTFPDTGKWVFNPFDFSATAGKLSRIVDRNGNTMTLGYNTGGKLVTVVDDLGRTNTIAYNTDGYVASVTDFTGRPVTYQYYHGLAGENGGLGDLASVTSPPVIGTPTGNDFPAGKTISYAYSMGFANEAENHLLLKVTDPKGAFASQFTYEHTSADPNYLHCIADQSGTNTASRFSWTVRAPQPGNFATTKCFINDPVGNLTECSFDSRNRLLLEREFTGRCVPGSPVTATVNRPTGKVRASDPDFYDTACVWNNDSLCTLMTLPLGNSLACFYARDLDGGTTARKKGDLRVKHELGSGGGADTDGDGFPDTTVLTTTYQYDSRFGFAARDYCVQYRESEMEFLRRATYWIKNSNSGGTPRIARYKGWDGTIKGLSMLPGPGDEGPQESLDFARKGWDGTIKGTSKYGRVKVQFHWDRESPRASYVNPRSISRQQYFFNQTCRLLPTVNKREKLRGTTKTQGDFNLANRFSFEIDFVTSTTDPRGNVSTASYDAKGNRPQCVSISTSSCGANKPVIDFVYDNHGLLTAITNCPDANCSRRVDTFSYYTNGSQAGYLQSCVVDATGLALASTFEYDPRGNMTRGIDPRTNDWLYTYNALDQIVQQQSATLSLCFCKITYNYKYDANDNVTLIEVQNRDGAGNLGTNAFWDTVLAYDQENRLISVTQPTSGPSTATTRYAYDGNDQCTLVSSPEAVAGRDPSNVTQYLYDERKMLFCVIDAPGTALQHNKDVSYDANGRVALVASTSDICGPTPGCKQADCTFVYDGFGRCVSFTDAMGNVGTCAYDRNANLIYTRVDAETNDVPGSVGNRRFAECRYSYDDLDRCVKLSNGFFDPATQTPVGNGIAVTTCAYAFNGECVSVTDALSHTCAFAYDTACRLASMTDARGDVVTCVRDRNGNPTSIAETDVSDLGGTQSFSTACTYDNLNRLVQCVDNVGNSNLFAYDSRDNCVSQTDPRGNETVFAYDGLSRPVSFTRYQGLAVAGIQLRGGRYTLDDNSRCVSSSDGNSNVTRYAYDARDRLVTITNADFTVQKLIWSPRSNLIGEQDANGSSISNTFDLCDRVTRRDITPQNALGTTTFETFAYDGLSRTTLASNDVSSVRFSYDSMDNTIRSTQDGLSQSATFDANGNRALLNCPSGATITYLYDVLDRMTNVATSFAGTAHPHLVSYAYDGPGRISRITRDNGINTRLKWDGLVSPANASGDFGSLQVSGVSHENALGTVVIDRRAALFDRNQNRIQRSQTVAFVNGTGTRSNTFTYDGLNQMKHAINTKGTGTAGIIDYTLDQNGNRQVVTSNGVTGTYTMDSSVPGPMDFQMNQYTTTPFGSESHDDNGNLVASGSSASPVFYQYDYANRLVAVSALSGLGTLDPVASFSYDALGRRISKTTYPPSPLAPITTQFTHGMNLDFYGIIDERVGAAVNHVYCWGGCSSGRKWEDDTVEITAAFTATGSPRYYHVDDLGNTLALTDINGNVVERNDYDDFGAPQFLTSDGSPVAGATASPAGNPYLFHGMEWDGETGLYKDNGMSGTNPMYEDPKTGRYISRQLHAATSLDANPYTVGNGNPWKAKVVTISKTQDMASVGLFK